MKIRTFITCEDIDITDDNDIVIKSMFAGLFMKKFPSEASFVLVLTFDDVETKPKELEVSFLNKKDKLMKKWGKNIGPDQNAVAMKLKTDIEDEGDYFLKITYDDEFLGKYPINFIRKGDTDE